MVHLATEAVADPWYVTEFSIGNPPQKLRGVFDTGSTELFIVNDKAMLLNNRQIEKHPKDSMFFHQELSKSYHATDEKVEVNFGGGMVKAIEAVDDFRVGAGNETTTIKDVMFGDIYESEGIFHKGGVEAIIGLAYPQLAEEGHTPLFDIMMKQHVFERNIFAFFLPNIAHNPTQKPEITMGYYDESKFTGEIQWHPVIDKKYFGLQLDDIKVDGKPLNICSQVKDPSKCIIAPDTGAPLNTMSTKLLQNF